MNPTLKRIFTHCAGASSDAHRYFRIAAKILRSFLPWRRYAKKPCKGSLPVKPHRQWTSYSCTAAVAQMV